MTRTCRDVVCAEMELASGKWVSIDGYVKYSEDTNYGADEDGNRGSYRANVIAVEDFGAYDKDGEDVALDEEETEQAKELLAEKFMEGC